MKLTSHIMHKVRNNAKRRLRGMTSLPTDKSFNEDWTTSTGDPSTEFSDDDIPDKLPVSRRRIKIEEKKEKGFYHRSPRLVCFEEEVLVRRVRPVYEIGGKIDRRELWYQAEEYKEIMWKARRLVKRAHNDEGNTNKEKYCVRGLEHVIKSMKRRTKSNLDGRDAVLDEQLCQFKEDIFPLDDDKIASVYLPHTKDHRAEAIERAKLDAKEVALYQRTRLTASAYPPAQMARKNPVASNSSSTHSLQQLSTSQVPLSNSSSTTSLRPLSKSTAPLTPITAQKRPVFTSPGIKSPSSPFVSKPGMMFTYVGKKVQYPPGMKLDPI